VGLSVTRQIERCVFKVLFGSRKNRGYFCWQKWNNLRPNGGIALNKRGISARVGARPRACDPTTHCGHPNPHLCRPSRAAVNRCPDLRFVSQHFAALGRGLRRQPNRIFYARSLVG